MSIEKAQADLADLTRKAERLQAELANIDSRIAKIRIFLELAHEYGGNDISITHNNPPAATNPVSIKLAGGAGKSRPVSEIAEMILRARGSHLLIADLYAELIKRDAQIGGEKPMANLSSILSRAPNLVNNRAKGWGLKEWSDAPSITVTDALTITDEAEGKPTSPTASPQPFEQSRSAALASETPPAPDRPSHPQTGQTPEPAWLGVKRVP